MYVSQASLMRTLLKTVTLIRAREAWDTLRDEPLDSSAALSAEAGTRLIQAKKSNQNPQNCTPRYLQQPSKFRELDTSQTGTVARKIYKWQSWS